jgi:IS5 family transposase
LALRQTEGLVGSIIELLGLDLAVPDHSTLSRRAKMLAMSLRRRAGAGPLHLRVDSTGLKLGGAGEWLVEKHGTQRRRSWRKLHMGVDASTGEIVAVEVTKREIDDAARTGALLDQLADEPLASFTVDGAYDQDRVYEAVGERHPDAAVIVPPRVRVPCRALRPRPLRHSATAIYDAAPNTAAWAGKRPPATIFGPRPRRPSADINA